MWNRCNTAPSHRFLWPRISPSFALLDCSHSRKLHSSSVHWSSHGRRGTIVTASLFGSRVIATAVSTAELRFSNSDTSTTREFASDTATMSGTEFGTATSYLLTTSKYTFLSTTVLDTKFGGRLSRLVAASNRTSTTTSMGGTETGTTHGRLAASIKFTSLSTTMGSAEILVSGSLVTTWEFTSTASTVGNTESCCTLGAFAATCVFTHSVAHVTSTVWFSSNSRFVASLDTTGLSRWCRNRSHSLSHWQAELHAYNVGTSRQ
mmetsp:Transcript_42264/g.102146  ORF Transcript_42264/g.102146 Transcript_42264/m.102146 type:complete len:263 (+) Transcript_42264:240-1028(+)